VKTPPMPHMLFRLPLMGWLVLAACATVPPDIEAPKVSIANIAPKDFSVFEQRFDVQLRVQNPNDADLGIKGMRFDIDLNNQEFANGMSGEKITVPRFGSEVVNVEVITGISSFLRQFQGLNNSGASKIQYRLKGTAFIDAPHSFKLPFDEKGEVNFSSSLPGEPSKE
jgi:LEA14-like dessication related protein